MPFQHVYAVSFEIDKLFACCLCSMPKLLQIPGAFYLHHACTHPHVDVGSSISIVQNREAFFFTYMLTNAAKNQDVKIYTPRLRTQLVGYDDSTIE